MRAKQKSSYSAIIVVVTCILMTVLFSFLLYFSYSKKKDINPKDKIGMLAFKKKSIQRKYGGQVVWEEIMQDMPVYNGDALRTERLSEAVIKLGDGSSINMEPETMVILSLGKESIDVGFNYGSMSVKREIKSDNFKHLKIQTDRMTLNIDKSNLQVKGGKDTALNVTVREGSADIISKDNKVVKVSKMEEAFIPGGSEEVHIIPISFSLLEPDNNKHFSSNSGIMHVPFRWEKKGDAESVIFELSGSSLFTEKLVSKETKTNTISLDLKAGTYYWRLRSRQSEKEMDVYSEIFKFHVIKIDPVRLLYPAEGQSFSYYSTPPAVTFQWGNNPLASLYRILISKDTSFTKPFVSRDIEGNALTEFSLDQGTWYWKVLIKTPFEDTYNDTGVSRSFAIEKLKILSPPVLLSPEENKRIYIGVLKKDKLNFNWGMSPDFITSEFLLSDDKDFKNIVLRRTTYGNYTSLDNPLIPGAYFWKVISSTQNKDLTLSSDTGHFRIMEEPIISLLSPPDNYRVEKSYSLEKFPLRFQWESNDPEAAYLFELSSSKDFGEGKLKKELNASAFTAEDIGYGYGSFYWRVTMMDKYQNVIRRSPYHQLYIIPTLDRPMLIKPRNKALINMRDRDSLKMSWEKIKGAEFYMVRLYNHQNGEKFIISETRTRRNSLSLTDLSKLDRGNFSWSVMGIRLAEDEKSPVIEGPESTGYFEITLGKRLDKPRIISPAIQYGE